MYSHHIKLENQFVFPLLQIRCVCTEQALVTVTCFEALHTKRLVAETCRCDLLPGVSRPLSAPCLEVFLLSNMYLYLGISQVNLLQGWSFCIVNNWLFSIAVFVGMLKQHVIISIFNNLKIYTNWSMVSFLDLHLICLYFNHSELPNCLHTCQYMSSV